MDECEERSGFLFPHRCGHPAGQVCAQCQKRICGQHTRQDQTGRLLCTTCAKGAPPAQPRQGAHPHPDPDPYFYSYYYYPTYHYHVWHHRRGPSTTAGGTGAADPHDFTAGDEGVVAPEGVGGGGDFGGGERFEDDMGGS
jgi:hypothetical protein